MGSAVVIENLGSGLYAIKRIYDTEPLERELKEIAEQESGYWESIQAALDTVRDLRQARDIARAAVDDVMRQWIDGLISAEESVIAKAVESAGTDVNESLADAVFSAINDQRSTAGVDTVTRDATLDEAAMRIARSLAASGRAGTIESAEQWVVTAGYSYDEGIGVTQLAALGAGTAERVIAQWGRGESLERLLDADYTECGVASVLAPRTAYGYLTAALLSAPGESVTYASREEEAATQAAQSCDSELECIEIPRTDPMQPEQLAEAVAIFARAANAYNAAEMELARLQVERAARLERKDTLEAARAEMERKIKAWCCWYVDDIEIGATVATAEIPGSGSVHDRITIIPSGSPQGRLRHAETMSGAITFFNRAMEPGHLRWKPRWRGGTIIDLTGGVATIALDDARARDDKAVKHQDRLPLDGIDERSIVATLNFPCASEVRLGDWMLIEYRGNRNSPVVIGWESYPRDCGGRVAWRQIR